MLIGQEVNPDAHPILEEDKHAFHVWVSAAEAASRLFWGGGGAVEWTLSLSLSLPPTSLLTFRY